MRSKAKLIGGILGGGVLGVVVIAAVIAMALASWGREKYESERAEFEANVAALDPAAHAPADVADEENAAHWLRRAAESVEPNERFRPLLDAPKWSSEQTIEARTILASNEKARDLVERAVDAEGSSFGIDYHAGQPTLAEDLVPLLRVRDVLALDGRLALAEGDSERALDAARGLDRLRTSLFAEPLLIFHLLGFAVDEVHLDLVERFLHDPGTETETLERLAEQMAPSGKPGDEAIFESLATEAAWNLAIYENEPSTLRGQSIERMVRAVQRPYDQRATLHLYRRMATAASEDVGDVVAFVKADRPWSPITSTMADFLVPNLAELPIRYRANRERRKEVRQALESRIEEGRAL